MELVERLGFTALFLTSSLENSGMTFPWASIASLVTGCSCCVSRDISCPLGNAVLGRMEEWPLKSLVACNSVPRVALTLVLYTLSCLNRLRGRCCSGQGDCFSWNGEQGLLGVEQPSHQVQCGCGTDSESLWLWLPPVIATDSPPQEGRLSLILLPTGKTALRCRVQLPGTVRTHTDVHSWALSVGPCLSSPYKEWVSISLAGRPRRLFFLLKWLKSAFSSEGWGSD